MTKAASRNCLSQSLNRKWLRRTENRKLVQIHRKWMIRCWQPRTTRNLEGLCSCISASCCASTRASS